MLGIQLHSMEVRGTGDLKRAFREAREAGVEALYVTPGPRVDQKMLADLILRNRIPSLATGALLVKRAALISYGSSMAHHYRRAAYYVDKILKGAKPGDLPVELATVFNLVVNMRTAKALGVTIPPTILLRATQVIE